MNAKFIMIMLDAIFGINAVYAQTNLKTQLRVKDSLLFDAVLKTCDLKQVEATFAADFQYSQDKGDGKASNLTSRTEFVGNIARRCAVKTAQFQVRRELVAGSDAASLVAPDYATQSGIQRFYLSAGVQPEALVEESHFTRIWKLQKGDWQISREMDYQIATHDPQEAAAKNDPLYKQVTAADSSLFAAYNQRNITEFKKWFARNLEFYHDKGGLSHYTDNMENFEKHFQDAANFSRRELVQGSQQVYPLNGYGALEIGVHRFYTSLNCKEQLTATANFINVWHQENGRWQLARVISYDHR
ncbi:nuclear transport factor 2 family protein [Mucilaginibacter sp. SJ]|uniref:nuclear transport factor 2 family protein n=1 Tax=Mucilaginibacter sp. SJ TaxID=3029053 RepID=UPI0023A9F45F|nr:nuclear transport factor 2 family protein [Mucilaginibacter sp. SJ]WEA00548.1 nuclear transport factor 2 family protein [Mucilaginibacter sp. SJ]